MMNNISGDRQDIFFFFVSTKCNLSRLLPLHIAAIFVEWGFGTDFVLLKSKQVLLLITC